MSKVTASLGTYVTTYIQGRGQSRSNIPFNFQFYALKFEPCLAYGGKKVGGKGGELVCTSASLPPPPPHTLKFQLPHKER